MGHLASKLVRGLWDHRTPTPEDPRPGYYSGHGQNAWLYNPGTQTVPCSEDPESCMNDPARTHFDNNDCFYFRGAESVKLFAFWWLDRHDQGDEARTVYDAAMSFGTTDFYTPGDYAALGPAAQSVGSGRAIHVARIPASRGGSTYISTRRQHRGFIRRSAASGSTCRCPTRGPPRAR